MNVTQKTKPADAEKVARICAIGGGTIETLSQALGWSAHRTTEAVRYARRAGTIVLRRTADKRGVWVSPEAAKEPVIEREIERQIEPMEPFRKPGPASVWEWAR